MPFPCFFRSGAKLATGLLSFHQKNTSAPESLIKLHISQLCFISLLLNWVRQAASKRQSLHENKSFLSLRLFSKGAATTKSRGKSCREPSTPEIPEVGIPEAEDSTPWRDDGHLPCSKACCSLAGLLHEIHVLKPRSNLSSAARDLHRSWGNRGSEVTPAWVQLWSKCPRPPAR